ncbi:hypothetical protein TIFTF001_028661 [Ficus carica]|uniref:Uncharacterized protein n=1 Tax=Ficus carica TaxID=3494 RepID=A0AA88J1F5_FICCA|nr:hypothetical protein TIFTF001_028661 [Ficus carica]
MATSTVSSLFPAEVFLTQKHENTQLLFLGNNGSFSCTTSKNRVSFRVQAVKPPAGVIVPKVQPKFKPPFAGFTRVAETWNSRACMIGLIGTFILEMLPCARCEHP